MIKIGLTGSIGMGKSTVAEMFADLGAAVWSADDAVHRMYAENGAAVEPVRNLFPEAIKNNAVDRAALAGLVLGAPEKLQALEAVVHPLVGADREAFMVASAEAAAPALVLDIPLLFENRTEGLFDAIVVVSAPEAVQRERVLARPGMSEAKLNAILNEQMPDKEKRARADYIIATDKPLAETRNDVSDVFEDIIRRATERSF